MDCIARRRTQVLENNSRSCRVAHKLRELFDLEERSFRVPRDHLFASAKCSLLETRKSRATRPTLLPPLMMRIIGPSFKMAFASFCYRYMDPTANKDRQQGRIFFQESLDLFPAVSVCGNSGCPFVV